MELVRLIPPDAWHRDQIDETGLDAVDYKLARLGSERPRVTVTLTVRWMSREHSARSEWVGSANQYWDNLVAALEEDCRKGPPARASAHSPVPG